MTFVPDDDWYQGIAPDNRAARAGRQVAEEGRLSQPRCTADGTSLAARCAGSSGESYTVQVDLSDPSRPVSRCDCGSFKSPCKHALALLWLWLASPQRFVEVPLPPEAAQARTPPPAPTPDTRRQDRASLGEEFLRSIREEPADDVRRLIYADWLEEGGDAADLDRARFIRLQHDRARLPANDPRQTALEKEERRLWTTYRKTWLADLPRVLRRRDVVFHRGFLEELRLSVRYLMVHGEDLMARFPLHRLRLEPAPGGAEAARLAVWPGLLRLRTLDLSGLGLSSGNLLRDLLDTPFLRPLEVLNLSRNQLTYHAVEALTACRYLERLHTLNLAGNPLGHRSATLLGDVQCLPSLRVLDVRGTGLGDRPILALTLRIRFGDGVLI
jgi:uncharacterized protein (TIGR02996 family)